MKLETVFCAINLPTIFVVSVQVIGGLRVNLMVNLQLHLNEFLVCNYVPTFCCRYDDTERNYFQGSRNACGGSSMTKKSIKN